jgi:hypothetical protein
MQSLENDFTLAPLAPFGYVFTHEYLAFDY